MKKIIVTGSEGFIGKALTYRLKELGHTVIGIDRKSGIEAGDYFANADLSNIDCVFHLAAQTSVFNQDHDAIMRDNVDVFRLIAERCNREKIKLVYASSSTANSANTTSLYGISKHFDEGYARCYCPTATGVRLHNVYGKNPREGTLLHILMNQKTVRLTNLGFNIRHFTHIDNVVEGLIKASKLNTNLINIANPRSTTTRDFASEVARYNGIEIQLVREKRDFDVLYQMVNHDIDTLSLQYIPYKEGIRKIFYE